MLVLFLMVLAGLAFAPTGVPLGVFSEAEPSRMPKALLSAAKFERLHNYAVSMAVRDHVEPRGPGIPQPASLLTYVRGRLFSGEEKMTAYALERAQVTRRIHGWENAAIECFEKPTEDLSLADAAVLLIHMKSPSTVWDDRADELLRSRNAFLQRMTDNGYATANDTAAAMRAPLMYCKG